MLDENSGVESPEINVDQILADVEAGRDPNAAPAETPAAAQAPEAPTWNGQEWEFEWNGKKIAPESRDKAKIWMSQGYNYSQRAGELNQTHAQRMAEVERVQREAQELQERFAPYKQVDEYAAKNKEWWDHVNQAFQKRDTFGMDPKLAEVVAPLREELGSLKQILTAQQDAAAEATARAEIEQADKQLDADVDQIRKSHPNIDLSARDESGETLERRVLQHAHENGIRSFRAAFRDYLHDELVVQSKAETKLQAVRGAQAQAKAGILGTTKVPTKELKPIDPRASWHDPALSVQAILAEHRSINGG